MPLQIVYRVRDKLIELARNTYPVEDVYIYAADIYCESCGELIREDLAGDAPDDPDDEYSYDSDDYPKGPVGGGGGESDSVQHCGSHAACLNAIVMPDGTKIGAWLGNDLTTEGVNHLCEVVHENGDVAVLWSVWYEDPLEESGCPPIKKRVIYRPMIR